MKNSKPLIFILFLTLLLIPFSSASYAEWVSFGSSQSQEIQGGVIDSRILNTQLSDVNADFLNNNITQVNITNFQSQTGIADQMLIGSIGGSSFPFLITSNDTAISLYTFGSFNGTYNYTLFASYPLAFPTVQISLRNGDGDMILNQIINSTTLFYTRIAFDIGTKTFSVNNSVTVELPDINVYDEILPSAIKCDGNNCYTMISARNLTTGLYDYFFFNGTLPLINIYNDTGSLATIVNQPPSKVESINGTVYYMFHTDKHLVVFNESYNVEFVKTMSYGGASQLQKEFIQAGTFIRNSVGEFQVTIGTYRSLLSTEFTTCDDGFTCSRLYVYDLAGTTQYNFDVSSDTSFSHPQTGSVIRGFSLYDYDGDGYEDIWIANGNFNPSIYIFKGNNGNLLFANSTAPVGGTGATDLIPKMNLGTLTSSGTGKAFVIYDALGYVSVQNPYSTEFSQMFRTLWTSFTGVGSCVTGDLDGDLFLDIACGNANEISVFFGQDYRFPIVEVEIITGNDGFTNMMQGISNLFPDESELTAGEMILFVVIFMVLLFFMFLLPALLIKNAEITKIMIYLGLFADTLMFFYFIVIGYVHIGVLITLVLIGLALAYLKVVKGG